MNPDFALVICFSLAKQEKFDPDFLVKTARNIGARAVSGSPKLKAACQKYTIALIPEEKAEGKNLKAEQAIAYLVQNKRRGQASFINLTLNQDGSLTASSKALCQTINSWMHQFGHAFNEGQSSRLTVDHGFILANRHAPYQKYVFIEQPLPAQITVTGLAEKPSHVEWIEKQQELAFNFKDKRLIINLTKPAVAFPWQALRIQAHRPEDDLKSTKF